MDLRLEQASYKKRIRIVSAAVLAVIVIITVSLMTPCAHADNISYEEYFTQNPEAKEKAKELLEDYTKHKISYSEFTSKLKELYVDYAAQGATEDYTENMWSEFFSDSELNEIDTAILSTAVASSSIFKHIAAVLNNDFYKKMVLSEDSPGRIISSGLTGIGLCIIIVSGIIRFLMRFERGETNLDIWLSSFVSVIIAILVLIFMDDIVNAIDALGAFLVEQVSSQLTYNNYRHLIEDSLDVTTSSSSDSWLTVLVSTVSGTVSSLFSALSSYTLSTWTRFLMQATTWAMSISAFVLFMEMALRRAFLPLAIADMSGEGIRSPGYRYLKAYVSLYIREAMFFAIAYAATLLENYAWTADWGTKSNMVLGSVGMSICIRAATTAVLSGASRLSREIVGA